MAAAPPPAPAAARTTTTVRGAKKRGPVRRDSKARTARSAWSYAPMAAWYDDPAARGALRENHGSTRRLGRARKLGSRVMRSKDDGRFLAINWASADRRARKRRPRSPRPRRRRPPRPRRRPRRLLRRTAARLVLLGRDRAAPPLLDAGLARRRERHAADGSPRHGIGRRVVGVARGRTAPNFCLIWRQPVGSRTAA